LSSGSQAGRDLAELLASPDQLSERDLSRAAELVVAGGGRDWTEGETRAQLTAAATCVDATPMPDDVRAEFASIAEFITARQC
jgi:geranylgeranyl diphosphate synthase type I